MAGTGQAGSGRRAAAAGMLAFAVLMMAGGCARAAETVERESAPRSTSPSPSAAMRVVQPETLTGIPESASRRLREQAQQNTDNLKQFLDGEATSEVGSVYALRDSSVTYLLSAVSGKVTDPKASLDKSFADLPKLAGVKPSRPGPMGGEARCGSGETEGVPVTVCMWADNDTIGMVAVLGMPGVSPSLFVRVRSQVQWAVA